LGVVLDALADAVTIRGADNRLLYARRAAPDRSAVAPTRLPRRCASA
jgi:hypothetical protein